MQEILRIQGQEVDLIPNKIQRTIQINDLGSAEGRESSYSQTVKLPKTSKNQRIFNFLGSSGNMSTAPYIQLSCDYIVDGIPLIINGYAEVKSTGSHYEVVIYDGVIDLAEKLKGKTLSTLNYSDLNHYLSSTNYIDSFTNTEGYIYALGRFIDDKKSSIKVERQIPSVYTHTLWDKIFSQLGINYRGDFFNNNQDFRSEVVTPPQGYEVQDVSPTITAIGSYNTDTVSYFEMSEDYIYTVYNRFSHNTTFVDSRVTFSGGGVLVFNQTMNTEISLDVTYSSNSGYNTVRAVLNGGTIKSKQLEPQGTNLTFSVNLSVEAGDELYFTTSGSDTGYVSDGAFERYTVDYSASASISISEATGGFLIDFNKIMGDLPQIDFIKDVMQRYGLVLKPIKGGGGYDFIQFEELLNDRYNFEDWSDKLSTITNEEYGVKYAKENIASYSYHEDIVVPTHDGKLTVNNENADAEKSLFKSPYEIPIKGIRYNSQDMYLHPVWEIEEEDGAEVIKVREAPIKTFRLNKVNGSMSAFYFNDTNATTFTGDIPYLSLENMGMQYFLNVYYKAYNLAIDKYKEVDVELNLNLLDIEGLNLFKLKYLRQTGKLYYLNEIKHSVGSPISSGKLIEINEFSTNLPVETLGTYTKTMSYDTTRVVTVDNLTTQTDPAYYDPENNAPYAIRFTSGFNTDIKLYQNGVEIIDNTEILVSEWDVTLVDMGNITSAHTASWNFQIADVGSKVYGDAVGTLTSSVPEFNNTAPVADAGTDKTIDIIPDGGATFTSTSVDGSGSYDSTDSIQTYEWVILSKPTGSTAYRQGTEDTSDPTSTLIIPNETVNLGTYTYELTVTDSFGATGTDTVSITVRDGNTGSGNQ